MRHASKNYIRAAIGWLLLAGAAAHISVARCVAQSAVQMSALPSSAIVPRVGQVSAQQTSLQQAMLRSANAASASDAASEFAVPSPSTNVADALQSIAAQAGVVFTGSVTAVQAEAGGAARVRFQVERGIRGVASGVAYTVRVSAWAGGADCFFPGERALYLLTAPTTAGFSAPVMGERGIAPLTGDALVGNLDLRWIAADMQRGTPAATEAAAPVRAAAVSTAAPFAATAKDSSDVTSAVDSSSSQKSLSLPDVHAIDRDLVLDLLRSAASNAGRARS